MHEHPIFILPLLVNLLNMKTHVLNAECPAHIHKQTQLALYDPVEACDMREVAVTSTPVVSCSVYHTIGYCFICGVSMIAVTTAA